MKVPIADQNLVTELLPMNEAISVMREDLAAAQHVYAKARERGLGSWVEIGGRHFGSSVEG